jgi:hypothetical protein
LSGEILLFETTWKMEKIWFIIISMYLSLGSILFAQNEICETCVEYTLEFVDNKLQGSSPQLAGYDVSMNLPPGFFGEKLSIDYLFSLIRCNDIRGEFIFPNGQTTEIRYSLIPYRDTLTVFMKTANGWYPWDSIRIENDKLIFSYDYWYRPPASKIDLEILSLCFDYLKDSTYWHQNDDRGCEDDSTNNTWSLFCAVKIASITIMKEYNHRNTVVQTTRDVIDVLYPAHEYEHTVMDFNNDPSTGFNDIIKVLNFVKNRIEAELQKTEE